MRYADRFEIVRCYAFSLPESQNPVATAKVVGVWLSGVLALICLLIAIDSYHSATSEYPYDLTGAELTLPVTPGASRQVEIDVDVGGFYDIYVRGGEISPYSNSDASAVRVRWRIASPDSTVGSGINKGGINLRSGESYFLEAKIESIPSEQARNSDIGVVLTPGAVVTKAPELRKGVGWLFTKVFGVAGIFFLSLTLLLYRCMPKREENA